MGELMDYFREKYSKNDRSETKDMMGKQKVKNTISDLCEKYIQDSEDTFTFEVLPSDLSYALSVVNEEPLKSKYLIYQISDTLFIARLKSLEL